MKRGVIIQCLSSRKQLFTERSFSVDALPPERNINTQLSPLTASSSINSDNPSALRRLLSHMEFNKKMSDQSVDEEEYDEEDDEDFDDNSDRNNTDRTNNNNTSANNNNNNKSASESNFSPSINLTVNSNDDEVFIDNLTSVAPTASTNSSNMPYLVNINQPQHRLLFFNYNDLNNLQQQEQKSQNSEGFYTSDASNNKANKGVTEVLLKSEPAEQMEVSLPQLVFNNLSSLQSNQTHAIIDLPRQITDQTQNCFSSLSQLYNELKEEPSVIEAGGKALYKQPSLLFSHLINAYKQLNDIWIRVH